MYRILFLHKDFPGQFLHLARHLAGLPGVEVRALASDPAAPVDGVAVTTYQVKAPADGRPHPYLHLPDQAIWRAQAVLVACVGLQQTGFVPDLVIGHNGWGETLFIKDVWPRARLIGYCEFYYHGQGADVGCDPEFPATLGDVARVRVMNAVNLLTLEAMDRGVSPTRWQHGLHPAAYRDRISRLHDGIDTVAASPGPARPLTLPDGRVLAPGTPIVTYVARDLEPYRGFHTLMRAASLFLEQVPDAHLVIAGGDGVSYGNPPREGGSWRTRMLSELAGRLPLDRVHFLGHVPHDGFINLMRLSRTHVYLTYPFVLSWSMLEAMACGVTLVASATPPVQEVVAHGANGLLVPPLDPAAIAAGIVAALALPASARRDLGAAARQTVLRHFDSAQVAMPAWLGMLRRDFGLPD
ncbi:glycosyltransferase [Niveispirillum fermenti]|uniref:glycosyltransferase n=1 Tax=Niveispirillum fermenti TaxID=1233113 RepID=UPI003A8908B2